MILRGEHLKVYINSFVGYGDYRAKYWLVGMEEGGGGSFEEVSRRLAKWEAAGRPELLDLRGHHHEGDLTTFVGGSTKLQKTWSQLIRIVLSAEGRPTDNDAVRAYQQHRLGRFGGEACLLELMPLPSPDAGTWLYRDWSLSPDLRTRATYMRRHASPRASLLRQRIIEHRPQAVVFYSLSYLPWWRLVAGVPLSEVSIADVKSFVGHSEQTVFVVVQQPAHRSKGKGNNYYVQVGRLISESLTAREAGVRRLDSRE
jgi:hypothetical protein